MSKRLFLTVLFGSACLLVWHLVSFSYTIGVEYVNNYPSSVGSDLDNCGTEVKRFKNELGSKSSWTKEFCWGNGDAWEEDFKKSSKGGTDAYWIDDVDIAMFAGHGNKYKFHFGSTHDDHYLHYTDASWGDDNLEWIIIDACQVLKYDGGSVFDRWGPTFKGLHYILSFHTNANDSRNRGKYFAKYADGTWHKYTVRKAWRKACKLSAKHSRKGAYLRAFKPGTNTYDDHLHGFGKYVSPDPDPLTGWEYANWSC